MNDLPRTWQEFKRGSKPDTPTARCPLLFDILHQKHWQRIRFMAFPQHHTRQERRDMARLAARNEMREVTSKPIPQTT